MPNIPFPNVPKVSGVPPIPRSPNYPPTTQAAFGLVQSTLWRVAALSSQWGIYDADGNALADPAKFQSVREAIGLIGTSTLSTVSVSYSKEMVSSDFPVERGSFASYNKVEKPAEPEVAFAFQGSESDRTKFLNNLDAATKSTKLFNVVTPEVTYTGYSIDRYSYERRSTNGMTLLVVQISLKEIRQVEPQYSKVKVADVQNPASVSPTDNGKVQAKTPDISTVKSLWNKVPPSPFRDYVNSLIKGN